MRKWLYSLLAAGALVAAGLLQAAFGPGPGKHLDADGGRAAVVGQKPFTQAGRFKDLRRNRGQRVGVESDFHSATSGFAQNSITA